MNLSGIETFLAIVETQSLSKASEKLFLSQSTVSNRLNILEKDLNTKLIERNQGQRLIKLTSKGEEFVSIAKQWMALQKNTDLWINKKSPLKLSIGSVDSLNSYLCLEIFTNIIQNEPSFELDISTHWSSTVFSLLESYEIDVGLVPRSIKIDSLLTTPIFSEKLVVISNPNFTNIDEHIHPEELDIKKEVFLDWGASFQIWHDSCWDPAVAIEVTVDTVFLIFKFINKPGMWAILPESIAHAYSKTNCLKVSNFIEEPPERIIYKVVHRDPLPRIIRPLKIFESYLQEFINKNPFLTKL